MTGWPLFAGPRTVCCGFGRAMAGWPGGSGGWKAWGRLFDVSVFLFFLSDCLTDFRLLLLWTESRF
jgi:hypothetical protein